MSLDIAYELVAGNAPQRRGALLRINSRTCEYMTENLTFCLLRRTPELSESDSSVTHRVPCIMHPMCHTPLRSLANGCEKFKALEFVSVRRSARIVRAPLRTGRRIADFSNGNGRMSAKQLARARRQQESIAAPPDIAEASSSEDDDSPGAAAAPFNPFDLLTDDEVNTAMSSPPPQPHTRVQSLLVLGVLKIQGPD